MRQEERRMRMSGGVYKQNGPQIDEAVAVNPLEG